METSGSDKEMRRHVYLIKEMVNTIISNGKQVTKGVFQIRQTVIQQNLMPILGIDKYDSNFWSSDISRLDSVGNIPESIGETEFRSIPFTINMSNFGNGIYRLRIYSGDRVPLIMNVSLDAGLYYLERGTLTFAFENFKYIYLSDKVNKAVRKAFYRNSHASNVHGHISTLTDLITPFNGINQVVDSQNDSIKIERLYGLLRYDIRPYNLTTEEKLSFNEYISAFYSPSSDPMQPGIELVGVLIKSESNVLEFISSDSFSDNTIVKVNLGYCLVNIPKRVNSLTFLRNNLFPIYMNDVDGDLIRTNNGTDMLGVEVEWR